ncbi:ricin B lectin domain-containing protein [Mycena alexandri]|uniref:Ricin B lectin domain-containing protein n=2 Tax=Mycena alexandri TaxID=1745969 RepID=A0AAD6TIE9_9AGAR|nr:ricin B lectin domain-containing protein [Mycena alexandri]
MTLSVQETDAIQPRVYATSINANDIALTSPVFIHPTSNDAICLTAASNTDGAAVEIEDCISGFAPQSWTVSGSSIQIFDNMCLDVTGGSSANGTPLQIWTCTEGDTNQLWTQSPGNLIRWEGSCLDLTDGSAVAGNIMQIWVCTGGPNQQWVLRPTTTMPGVPPTPMNIQLTGNAAKCLTPSSNTDGAAVKIQDCVAGSASQSWIFSGSSVQIFDNMCLDVTGGSAANGTPLQIWTCTEGDTNQIWTVFESSVQIFDNMCLDVTGGSSANGTPLQIWTCTEGDTNQIWTQSPGNTITWNASCLDLTDGSATDGNIVRLHFHLFCFSLFHQLFVLKYCFGDVDAALALHRRAEPEMDAYNWSGGAHLIDQLGRFY